MLYITISMRETQHIDLRPFIPEPRGPEDPSFVDNTTRNIQLIATLRDQQPEYASSVETGLTYLNGDIASLAANTYDRAGIHRLETSLAENGAFNVPIAYGTLTIEGNRLTVPFVAATETDAYHGEMSSMLYLRDHIQVSRAFMELHMQDPATYEGEGEMGRALLHSALTLMSTPNQLDRFERVIELGNEAGQAEWPQISLYFHDLAGNNPNGWRNKQDALQMLGHLTFDALERGFIDVRELSEQEEMFLGHLVPFMAAIGFPRYESSGSWEELTAVRTSVMAVETALLHKMLQHVIRDDPLSPKYGFLHQTYAKYRPSDAPELLEAGLRSLVSNGLLALGQRLPFESGTVDHEPDTIKHREADAALVYVLMYDLPRILADNNTPIGQTGAMLSATEIEHMVLAQLDGLIDAATGGMKRYDHDSYQRTNFHTNQIQERIRNIKLHVRAVAESTGNEPDLDMKQEMRDQAVAEGREAAWTHPIGQLAAWAARRSLSAESRDQATYYPTLSTKYLNQALRLVTGHGQPTAALQPDDTYRIEQLPAYKLPEAFITYRDDYGDVIVASPHTPLNWSTAMLREATGLLRVSIQKGHVSSLGRTCVMAH